MLEHKFILDVSDLHGMMNPCCAVQRQQALVVSAAATAAAEQKIRIKLRAYDAQLLQQSVGLISDAASSTGARVSGPVYLPTR